MPRTGRPKAELVVTDDEREQLVPWSRRRKSSQALALRSRIVLACAAGMDNKTVASELGCAQVTVGKWRGRFVEHRLDGLTDEARPGRPTSITVDQIEDVVVATLESTPANATHWSRAKMAERSGLSKSTVGRIWKAFELKPHLDRRTDPQLTRTTSPTNYGRGTLAAVSSLPRTGSLSNVQRRTGRHHQPQRDLREDVATEPVS
jgi:transposase